MAGGVKNLRKIQFGIEATKGTEVNATEIWRGTGTIEDALEMVFVEEDVGYLMDTDRSYIPSVMGKLSFDEAPATFEHLPYILCAAVENTTTGVADGTGSGKVYQFDFPTTAARTIKSLTLEGGDNQQEEQMLYCFCEAFNISGAAKKAVTMQADWIGRQVAPGTFTAALTLDTVEEILFQKSKLYIDTSGGSYGGTQKTSTLLGFELDVTTGFIPKFTGDGNLYFTFEQCVGPEITLGVTFEHDATAVAEVAAFRAETERLVRVIVEGSALTTADTYTYKTLIIDVAGKWESFEKIGETDGNDIRAGVLRGKYNVTASDSGKIIVVNQVASL